VDVPANNFVTGGVFAEEYPIAVNPGQEGRGALFTLLHSAREYVNRYRINHMKPGRILYLLLNGDEPKSSLSFRDFQTGNRYAVELVQTSRGSDKNVEAAFYITMSLTRPSGVSTDYTIGRPGYYRRGVRGYQIRSIYISPEEDSLVFVIEREETDTGGANIRYMVETTAIK
jgi:predicted secreted protein